jgi:hypothetical protein
MCRQRNSDDAFRLEAPELAPAVPKMPTLLDGAERAGKTNISKYETRSSESAGLELTSYGVTDTIFGGTMTKRNGSFEKGKLEAMARLRNQNDEFCRRLQIAVEMGIEFCPTTVTREPCTKHPISNYTRPDDPAQ